MKPILQINHKQLDSRRDNRSFPLTDYAYQATTDAKSGSSAVRPARKSPAFYKLSSEFFGAETSRDYIGELLFFILIAGLAAWPVISAIIAVIRMIRNY
jgi:hypothetical protein